MRDTLTLHAGRYVVIWWPPPPDPAHGSYNVTSGSTRNTDWVQLTAVDDTAITVEWAGARFTYCGPHAPEPARWQGSSRVHINWDHIVAIAETDYADVPPQEPPAAKRGSVHQVVIVQLAAHPLGWLGGAFVDGGRRAPDNAPTGASLRFGH
jgi:hypothetical protein